MTKYPNSSPPSSNPHSSPPTDLRLPLRSEYARKLPPRSPSAKPVVDPLAGRVKQTYSINILDRKTGEVRVMHVGQSFLDQLNAHLELQDKPWYVRLLFRLKSLWSALCRRTSSLFRGRERKS